MVKCEEKKEKQEICLVHVRLLENTNVKINGYCPPSAYLIEALSPFYSGYLSANGCLKGVEKASAMEG